MIRIFKPTEIPKKLLKEGKEETKRLIDLFWMKTVEILMSFSRKYTFFHKTKVFLNLKDWSWRKSSNNVLYQTKSIH